jgi:hypothetical protein
MAVAARRGCERSGQEGGVLRGLRTRVYPDVVED